MTLSLNSLRLIFEHVNGPFRCVSSCLAVVFALTMTALPAQSGYVGKKMQGKFAPKKKNVMLFGQIDELSLLCSAAGVQLNGKKMPATVSKISLGSAASYSGLREGDKVLQVRAADNVLVMDIERNNKRYQASIATDVTGLRAQFESRKIPFSFGDSPSDQELKTLAGYRIVILLDRSQSMNDSHAGCPGNVSKWVWCKEQIDNLFLATDRVLEGGFDLVIFNNTFQESRGVTLYDLKQTFDRVKPEGLHKDIATPLASVLTDYFKRKTASTKPCIILVLTDGLENSGEPLQNVLIEASKKASKPGEAIVNFLQVGDSLSAEELFDDLEHNLMAKGARFHMANYKPFAELRNKGVLWELLAAVREDSRSRTMPRGTVSGETR